MAIDTLNEKLALIEYGEVYQPGIPVSNDGLDQADNQQLLWEYPGFLWGALIVKEPEIIELTGTLTKELLVSGVLCKTKTVTGKFNKTVELSGQLRE